MSLKRNGLYIMNVVSRNQFCFKRFVLFDGFVLFWNNYPKKVGKGKAEAAWKKHTPNIDDVLKTLDWQKQSKEWFKENGAFIPHPTTYINGKRWLDEPTEENTF